MNTKEQTMLVIEVAARLIQSLIRVSWVVRVWATSMPWVLVSSKHRMRSCRGGRLGGGMKDGEGVTEGRREVEVELGMIEEDVVR